jgi:hypothetical protein
MVPRDLAVSATPTMAKLLKMRHAELAEKIETERRTMPVAPVMRASSRRMTASASAS